MEQEIARSLLDIGAISLRVDPPFTWASGRLSPIYCDNRLLMAFPKERQRVALGFKALLAKLGWSPDVIAGTATAGIPHAAWLSAAMDLPMTYVRSSAKAHGKQSQVEGRLEPGQSVVLIEDLVSTGKSSIQAAKALIESDAKLLGVAAIFTYGLPTAQEKFDEAGVTYTALTSFEALMTEALHQGTLTAANKAILADWQKDPITWSTSRGGAG